MDQDSIPRRKFNSIHILKKALRETNSLLIIHPDAIWIASFEWNNPMTINQDKNLPSQLSIEIPKDLLDFWTEISDGCLLYYDQKYGQWGYKIYSSSEIEDQQLRWKDLFTDQWYPNFLAIGEITDVDHPIIVMYKDDFKRNLDYFLVEGNPLDPIKYWPRMANSIYEWMDRLITAQGAKYWDWC